MQVRLYCIRMMNVGLAKYTTGPVVCCNETMWLIDVFLNVLDNDVDLCRLWLHRELMSVGSLNCLFSGFLMDFFNIKKNLEFFFKVFSPTDAQIKEKVFSI